jgi:hypothetical protein
MLVVGKSSNTLVSIALAIQSVRRGITESEGRPGRSVAPLMLETHGSGCTCRSQIERGTDPNVVVVIVVPLLSQAFKILGMLSSVLDVLSECN